MNFDFSEEQYLLRDTVRRFLAEQWGPRPLRAAGAKFSPKLWGGLSELGLTTLLVPEADGGSGLGFVDLVLVLEEFGRALVPGPIIDTLLASDVLARFGTPEQRKAMLGTIAAGEARLAFAHMEADRGHTATEVALAATESAGKWQLQGEKILVPAAEAATHLIVSAKPKDGPAGLFLCDASDEKISIRTHRAIDPDSLLAEVRFEGAPAQRVGGRADGAPLARLIETSTLAAATQMVGIGAAALDIAVEYSKQRTQFDRLIGSFQAIKHKCAEMFVAVESARPSAYYAAWAADDDEATLPLAASMAKAACGDACRLACNEALQIHGGVGFTWEFDIHLFMKRGKLLEYAFGDASFHRERVASILFAGEKKVSASIGDARAA